MNRVFNAVRQTFRPAAPVALVRPALAPPLLPQQTDFEAPLPSSLEGADFQAGFRVVWVPLGGVPIPQTLGAVKLCLCDAARRFAREHDVLQWEELQAWLNYHLPRLDLTRSNAQLHACAVTLGVSREASRAATTERELRRELELTRIRQDKELFELDYLHKILTNPALARAYQFKRHPDNLNALDDDAFERVAARFTVVPDGQSPAAARLAMEFFTGLSPAERALLIGWLGEVFVQFGRVDLSDRLVEEAVEAPGAHRSQ